MVWEGFVMKRIGVKMLQSRCSKRESVKTLEVIEDIVTGNYSFWILLVGVLQLMVMIISSRRK